MMPTSIASFSAEADMNTENIYKRAVQQDKKPPQKLLDGIPLYEFSSPDNDFYVCQATAVVSWLLTRQGC
jgi:hypothetical protein